MNDYEKLEYIHCALQEAMSRYNCWGSNEENMLEHALKFVEDLREPHLKEKEVEDE